MDPITLTLISLGAAALVAIVFFFLAVENAKAYQKEVDEANRKMEALRRKAEEERQRRLQFEQEKERREIEELLKKIKEEQEQWKKETSIASAIVEIAANPSIPNIVKLVRLIYESLILRKHIKDPENATSEVRRRVDEFVRKSQQSL